MKLTFNALLRDLELTCGVIRIKIMCLNVKKGLNSTCIYTKSVYSQQSNFNFRCSGFEIEYCNEYKYLSIKFYLNENLNDKQMIDHIALSRRRTLAGIFAQSKTLGGLMYKSYAQLFTSLVVPILDYGPVIWGHTDHPNFP